jgi:Fe-Mn family superoxide dismutase
MSYSLPSLSYRYESLEPYFDRETMEIHHLKHHQAYVNNTNIILKELDLPKVPIESLITHLDKVPDHRKTFFRNNVGGHINHTFFWKNLKIGTSPYGALRKAIEDKFGTVSSFQDSFEKVGMSRFGSGWAWLVKDGGDINIVSTANQDNPLMGEEISGSKGIPIIGLDLWEHSYYLKYQNRRLDYIKAFWKTIDWEQASINYASV